LAAGFAAAFGAAAGLGAAALAGAFAAAGFDAALDFAAGLGLEAADAAAFGLAVLDLDGALAMVSPTPRKLLRVLAVERTPARVSIRQHTGV
jgi:hypothetical protein